MLNKCCRGLTNWSMITATMMDPDLKKGTTVCQNIGKYNLYITKSPKYMFVTLRICGHFRWSFLFGDRYTEMSYALRKAGLPILYSICEWEVTWEIYGTINLLCSNMFRVAWRAFAINHIRWVQQCDIHKVVVPRILKWVAHLYYLLALYLIDLWLTQKYSPRGVENPVKWAGWYGNVWRTTGDIKDSWERFFLSVPFSL